jgi:hypothetical protein
MTNASSRSDERNGRAVVGDGQGVWLLHHHGVWAVKHFVIPAKAAIFCHRRGSRALASVSIARFGIWPSKRRLDSGLRGNDVEMRENVGGKSLGVLHPAFQVV